MAAKPKTFAHLVLFAIQQLSSSHPSTDIGHEKEGKEGGNDEPPIVEIVQFVQRIQRIGHLFGIHASLTPPTAEDKKEDGEQENGAKKAEIGIKKEEGEEEKEESELGKRGLDESILTEEIEQFAQKKRQRNINTNTEEFQCLDIEGTGTRNFLLATFFPLIDRSYLLATFFPLIDRSYLLATCFSLIDDSHLVMPLCTEFSV
jgi:hypothetical protein